MFVYCFGSALVFIFNTNMSLNAWSVGDICYFRPMGILAANINTFNMAAKKNPKIHFR